jgi:hypothetical protein
MFLIIIKFLILVAAITFFGWQFLRRVMKQDDIALLLPFSLGFGIISYIFFCNVFGYIIDLKILVWLLPFLMIVVGLLMKRLIVGELICSLPKRTISALIGISVIFGLLFSAIILTNYAYDEEWHGGIIATMMAGNFPPLEAYVPDATLKYHYGFDLLAASIGLFSGASLNLASDLAMILVIIPIFWGFFIVFTNIAQSRLAGWISAWLFFFAGGFRYLTLAEQIDWSRVKYVWDIFGQIAVALANVLPMSPGLFHSYSVDSYGVLLYHRPTLLAGLTMIFIIWLIWREQEKSTLLDQILLALAFSFLALSAETWLVLMAVPWGIMKLWQMWSRPEERKRLFLSLATVTLITTFLTIFQGGVVSGVFLHPQSAPEGEGLSSFVWRGIPGLISYGAFYPLTEFKSWAFWILEWGFVLIFFPFLFSFYKKKSLPTLSLLLGMAVFTILLVFNIDYPLASRDLTRLNAFAFLILALLLGPYLADRFAHKRIWLALIIIATSISPLCFNLRLLPFRWETKGIYSTYEDKDNEMALVEKIKPILSESGAVLTATPYLVSQAWGRQVFWGNPEHEIALNREIPDNISRLLKEADLGYIKSRGVAYVYDNAEFRKYGGREFIERNVAGLEKVFDEGGDYLVYRIR